jgi:MSHA biogenesis protein MshP
MKKTQGFAIVAAIFLVVILSMLGAFMVSITNTQHLTSAQDLQGARAYRAARMGMEWAATSLCNGNNCISPQVTVCPAGTSLATPTPLDIAPDGFTVTVTCEMNTYQEAGPLGDIPRYIFKITSTATNSASVGSIGKIERSFTAFMEFPI